MRDKIAGALYGMALGNAVGMPAELWGRKRMKVFLGRIEEFLDGPAKNDVAFNYKKSQLTGDAGQTLALLDFTEPTDYEPDTRDIALRILTWAERENALESNTLGPTSRVTLVNFRDSIQDSRTTDRMLSNGGAVRIAPIDCPFRPEQKESTARYVYLMLRTARASDVTMAGAAMVAEAVSSAIMKDGFERIMEDVFGIEEIGYGMGYRTFSPRLGERLRTGLDIAGSYKGDDGGFIHKLYDVVGTGVGTIESVLAALSVAYYAQDPNLSCLSCANVAGGAGTIGIMATAVCGAFTGVGGIESECIQTLRQQNDAGLNHYIRILEKRRKRFA